MEAGAKKRTSNDFSSTNPATSGHTTGRNNRLSQVFTGRSDPAAKGISVSQSGALSAALKISAAAFTGTAFLSSGMGSPCSTT